MSDTNTFGNSSSSPPLKLTRKTYSPDSPTDLDDLINERDHSNLIDQSNVILKTPQSLDDLLDVDDHNNDNEEDPDENDNEDNDDDDVDNDDDDSTDLTSTNPKTRGTSRQKRSNDKKGKISSFVK